MRAFFRTSHNRSCPGDHWESLESLTFRVMGVYNESFTEDLVVSVAGLTDDLCVKLAECVRQSYRDVDDEDDQYGSL